MSEKRNFVLLDCNNDVVGHYKSTTPRGAALKAVTKTCDKTCTIRIRETYGHTVRMYQGRMKKLPKPVVLVFGDRTVVHEYKPHVKYMGSYHLASYRSHEQV